MSGTSTFQKEWQKQVKGNLPVNSDTPDFFIPLDDEPSTTKSSPASTEELLVPDGDEKPSPRITKGMLSVSFIVSLIVHLNLILLLAAIWMMQEKEEFPVGLISTIAEQTGESEQLDYLQVESLMDTESEETEPQTDLDVADKLSEISAPLASIKEFSVRDSKGDGKNKIGFKMGRAGFFGAQAEGNSFLFIVDNSGSMDGPRFTRAITELTKTINGLNDNQTFYVIFYNSVAVPMPFVRSRRLLPATGRNKAKAMKWIRKQSTGGGTVPQEAVVLGLKMRPQVVFFLTDGQMPPDIRTTFIDHNKRSVKTVVHTIAFQTRVGEPTLKGIAKDNKGRYRFVK